MQVGLVDGKRADLQSRSIFLGASLVTSPLGETKRQVQVALRKVAGNIPGRQDERTKSSWWPATPNSA